MDDGPRGSSQRAENVWTLELRPRDPILVRDARPFAADPGARAVTLEWPLPVTIAGALRTHIGNEIEVDWSNGSPALVRDIAVQGPFLLRRGADGSRQVYFPAPRDAVVYRNDADETRVLRLRPIAHGVLPAGAGSDLWPGLRPVRVEHEVKPSAEAAFWSASDVAAWLGDARSTAAPRRTHRSLPTDVRTHVAIQPGTLTQVEGALFSTEALAFDPRGPEATDAPNEAMLCRLTGTPTGWRASSAFVRIGGEGRQVEIVPAGKADPWPRPPDELIGRLAGSAQLRMELVSPGLFARDWTSVVDGQAPPGWLPEWIDQQTLRGKPPRWPGPDWTLVSVVGGRRVPLSGWDIRNRKPKRTRYAVPAGSVYFFTLDAPLTPDQARALWLLPIADRAYDRRNGFGLALPGVWEWWRKEGS